MLIRRDVTHLPLQQPSLYRIIFSFSSCAVERVKVGQTQQSLDSFYSLQAVRIPAGMAVEGLHESTTGL